MCISDTQTAASNHLRVHNAIFQAPKAAHRPKNGGHSAPCLEPPLKPKVTTNENKEVIKVMEGRRMGIGDAQTTAFNHLRVHNTIFQSPKAAHRPKNGALQRLFLSPSQAQRHHQRRQGRFQSHRGPPHVYRGRIYSRFESSPRLQCHDFVLTGNFLLPVGRGELERKMNLSHQDQLR